MGGWKGGRGEGEGEEGSEKKRGAKSLVFGSSYRTRIGATRAGVIPCLFSGIFHYSFWLSEVRREEKKKERKKKEEKTSKFCQNTVFIRCLCVEKRRKTKNKNHKAIDQKRYSFIVLQVKYKV